MDANILFSEYIAKMPRKEPRSKLAPYEQGIRDAQDKGLSYCQIAEMLKATIGLQVAPKTIWKFLNAKCRTQNRQGKIASSANYKQPPSTKQNQHPASSKLWGIDLNKLPS